QENVRIAKESLCQQHTDLEIRRNVLHQALVMLLAYSELAEQGAGIAFCGVASHFSEFAFQLSCAHAIFFCEVGESVDLLTLTSDLPEAGVTHHHGVKDSL